MCIFHPLIPRRARHLRTGRLALLLAALVPAAAAQTSPTAAVLGGRVFDGAQFEQRDIYIDGGRFVDERPARLDTTIDAAGSYIVPPYGDFHNHALGMPFSVDAEAERYAREGTFYALNATATPWGFEQTRARFEPPGTVDAAFAVGVTSRYSHPQLLIESVFREYWGYFSRSLTPEQVQTIRDDRIAEGRGYWIAEDTAALDSAWTQMMAGTPDLIKVYLDDMAAGLADGDIRGHGLAPELIAEVVRRAHAAGLRVAAHVETADDARIAVEAGVDALMHLPGYRTVGLSDAAWRAQKADGWARYHLSDALVRQMAEQGTIVNPTLHLNVQRAERLRPAHPTRLVEARRVQFATLRRLHAAGVPVTVGLDGSGGTTLAEAELMARHRLFSPADVLRAWTSVTPRAIFPDRQIGAVAPGYEASLLMLACDPLADFACTQQITLRVKDGVVLSPLPPADG